MNNPTKQILNLCIAFAAAQCCLGECRGQNNSLHNLGTTNGRTIPLTMEQANIIRSQPVQPRTITVNDIVQIRVNELARMTVEGEGQRRKISSINAVLMDWVRLNGLTKLEPTGQDGNDPTIQAQLQQLYRAEGEIETTERLTFNIAARVADVRPNGILVLEAHKEIQVNNEIWKVALTGMCRQQDIGADGVVVSSSVVDLTIRKKDEGMVRDSYKRGWLMKAIDRYTPF